MKERKPISKIRKRIRILTKIIIGEALTLAVLFIAMAMMNLSESKMKTIEVGGELINEKPDTMTLTPTPTTEPIDKVEASKEELREAQINTRLQEARLLAAGYDYDAAITHLTSFEETYETIPEFVSEIEELRKSQAECVPFGAYKSSADISHLFFHSLIADPSKAFDGDKDSNGYNYYMITVNEFKEMMIQLYDQGYVLVSIHDVASSVTTEEITKYQEGTIMLPPDKKPFVISQDDVNYYDYMDRDGFASRIVLDEEGKPVTEMVLEDGTVQVGEYDLIPVLEVFIEEHPDFSYRGAKGMIALTGYEGTLGYRTDPASKDSKTFNEDKETVREIARVLRERGWEFACHSNGHRDMAACTQEFLEYDTNQWLTNVGSLVGDTDIYVFPFGTDVQAGAGTYTNARYQFLKTSGFRYYLGVFKDPWIQIKKDYVRMSRRPMDGQAMLQFPDRLSDLFDLTKIIDPARPKLK